jgi:hypothetical protein
MQNVGISLHRFLPTQEFDKKQKALPIMEGLFLIDII